MDEFKYRRMLRTCIRILIRVRIPIRVRLIRTHHQVSFHSSTLQTSQGLNLERRMQLWTTLANTPIVQDKPRPLMADTPIVQDKGS